MYLLKFVRNGQAHAWLFFDAARVVHAKKLIEARWAIEAKIEPYTRVEVR